MKRKILSVITAAVLAAGVFTAPTAGFAGTSITAEAASVTAPKASVKAGTYTVSKSISVKLTCSDTKAQIYYSTGGSYKAYTKAITISKSATLKCYSLKNGVKSKVVSYKYKLVPKVNFSINSGSFDSAVTVKLSSTASGVKFYYTLDGSKPTTKSKLYDVSGIKIDKTAKLRVLAYKSGWTKKYFTKNYEIKTTESGNLLDNYEQKYAYNTLNSTQKNLYAKIFEAVKNHENAVITGLPISADKDINIAYWAFDYENPQFFWLKNGYSYSYSYYNTNPSDGTYEIKPTYSRTEEQVKTIQPKFEQAAQIIIDKAMQKEKLIDRVAVIHNEIVDSTDYLLANYPYVSEADGSLIYGKALCEGYSKTFMYLCQSAGIECICVSGSSKNEPHMWNMIKLDGEWYHVDVTWDDPIGGRGRYYDYFCIPTSEITKDHAINNLFTIPSATSTKYMNYSD